MIQNKVIYGNVTVLDLAMALIILVVSIGLAKAFALYTRRLLKEKVDKGHLEIVVKVLYYAIVVTAVFVVLPLLGVKPSGLLVAGGVVGLAIGFASQSIIGNLISGIFLIIERPIKMGQSVNIEGTVGIVEDIRIMSTTLRTFEGLFVRIPNQKVFTTNITNYVANVARRVDYTIGIPYTAEAEKAISLIKKLIEAEPFALKNPEPMVYVGNLGDNSVDLQVRFWAPVSEWFSVKSKMLWRMKKTLEEEGIEIPFPQRVLWFANELKGTVKADSESGPVAGKEAEPENLS
ncbi:MAG: mechanosensitive ion channel family protein [Desulfobacteraceae bacterium]|nr:mechanosensitive ion channel family protein [Desulfobacteraceae bacterium]